MEDLANGSISREVAEKEYSLPLKMRQWLQIEPQAKKVRPRRRKKRRDGWWSDEWDED